MPGSNDHDIVYSRSPFAMARRRTQQQLHQLCTVFVAADVASCNKIHQAFPTLILCFGNVGGGKRASNTVHVAAALSKCNGAMGGGKRNDATSIHLIVLWVLRQTRVICAKCAPIPCIQPPAKVPRTNGCRLKPRVSQRRRADKENKHHRISKHPPWGSNPRPQG